MEQIKQYISTPIQKPKTKPRSRLQSAWSKTRWTNMRLLGASKQLCNQAAELGLYAIAGQIRSGTLAIVVLNLKQYKEYKQKILTDRKKAVDTTPCA